MGHPRVEVVVALVRLLDDLVEHSRNVDLLFEAAPHGLGGFDAQFTCNSLENAYFQFEENFSKLYASRPHRFHDFGGHR